MLLKSFSVKLHYVFHPLRPWYFVTAAYLHICVHNVQEVAWQNPYFFINQVSDFATFTKPSNNSLPTPQVSENKENQKFPTYVMYHVWLNMAPLFCGQYFSKNVIFFKYSCLMFVYEELYSSSWKLNVEFIKKQLNCRISLCFIERKKMENRGIEWIIEIW